MDLKIEVGSKTSCSLTRHHLTRFSIPVCRCLGGRRGDGGGRHVSLSSPLFCSRRGCDQSIFHVLFFHTAAVFGIPVSSSLPDMWRIFSALGGVVWWGGGAALCSQVASVRCCPPLSQLVNHTGTPAGTFFGFFNPPSFTILQQKWREVACRICFRDAFLMFGPFFFPNSIFRTYKAGEIQERTPSEGNHHQSYRCPRFILKSIYIDFRADSQRNNKEADFFLLELLVWTKLRNNRMERLHSDL